MFFFFQLMSASLKKKLRIKVFAIFAITVFFAINFNKSKFVLVYFPRQSRYLNENILITV